MRHLAIATLVGLALASTAQASILFSRDLPNASNGVTTYVNEGATGGRSNISWFEPSGAFIYGDDFQLSQNAVVTDLTVYAVSNGQVGTSNAPGTEFSQIQLFTGPAGGTLSLASSSFTSSLVGYLPGNVDYGGSTSTFYNIYALTFSGLNWNVGANTLYGFAVGATASQPGNTIALHATNAALGNASGVPQQGADDNFRYWDALSLAFGGLCNSGNNSCGPIWDKGSDINVVIRGNVSVVPEPSGIVLAGIGIISLLALRRRAVKPRSS